MSPIFSATSPVIEQDVPLLQIAVDAEFELTASSLGGAQLEAPEATALTSAVIGRSADRYYYKAQD